MSKYTTTINEYLNSELERMGFNEFVNNGELTFFDEEFQFIQKILKYDDDVHNIVTKNIFRGFQLPNVDIDKHFKKAFVTHFLDREINRQTIESFASQVLYVSITHETYINEVFSNDFMMYVNNTSFSESVGTGNLIGKTLSDTNTKNNAQSQSHENYVGNEKNETITHGDNKNKTNSQSHETYTGNETNETVTHGDNKNKSQETSQSTHEDTDVNESRSARSTLPQSEVNINVDNDELSYADENTITKTKDVKKGLDEGIKESTSDTTDDSKSNSDTDTTHQTDRNEESTSDTTDDSKSNSNTDTTHQTDRNDESTSTSRTDSNSSQNQDTHSTSDVKTYNYDIETLQKIFDMKEIIFNKYDKKCFLHIW